MFWVQPCVSLFWTAILCKPKIGHVKDISQVKRLWDLSQKNQDNFLCTLGVFSKSRIEVRVPLIGPFGTTTTIIVIIIIISVITNEYFSSCFGFNHVFHYSGRQYYVNLK